MTSTHELRGVAEQVTVEDTKEKNLWQRGIASI